MRKIISVCALVFLLSATGLAFAGGDLEVRLVCPASIHYGSGSTTLNVTAKVQNWDCSNSIKLRGYMSSLIANGGNTFGNIGVYGPYPQTLSVTKTIPAASCSQFGTTPGAVPGFLVPVMTVPNVTNKMAMAMVMFLTPANEVISQGMCLVPIVP